MTSPTNDAPTMWLVEPERRPLPESPAESALAALYPHAPGRLRVGMIRSRDGKAAGPDGSSRSLNGPADLRVLRTLRAAADVVLVGARTARVERYRDIALPTPMAEARAAAGRAATPALAIATYTGDLPDGATPDGSWVLTTADSPAVSKLAASWGERLLACSGTELSGGAMIEELARVGLTRVLCEGGPELARALAASGHVDEWCLTASPHPGGADQPTVPVVPENYERAHLIEAGAFAMERWVRPEA